MHMRQSIAQLCKFLWSRRLTRWTTLVAVIVYAGLKTCSIILEAKYCPSNTRVVQAANPSRYTVVVHEAMCTEFPEGLPFAEVSLQKQKFWNLWTQTSS